MTKTIHEIRDPIHGFINVDEDERKVLDSEPVQRLRHVHQLGLTNFVYPGATHRRFEHSLGAMELAGRVFDIIARSQNVHPRIAELIPEIQRDVGLAYWRRAIRMAGLCHDVGHLPFSHAAEHELLPDGWDHERLTVELIRSPEMEGLWSTMTPPLRSLDIAKLAVGKKKLRNETFSDWEALLSEIIVHDAFGVDRMDYLLRDSLHAGVAYGRFDHFRLIDTLRLLPSSLCEDGSEEPQVGIEEGGLHSAEALLLARYFMFSQMYFHPVRVIYDLHLKEFLHATLPGGVHPTDLASHLARTDIDVTGEMIRAASDSGADGHEAARRILQRQHFKVLWQRNPADSKVNLDPGLAVFDAAVQAFGEQRVRRVSYSSEWAVDDFPVRMPDGRIESAQALSHVLGKLPPIAFDYVFVNPDIRDQAKEWLRSRREDILRQPPEEE